MISIKSVGSYIPEQVITNKNLVERFATDFDLENWIIGKTGILERRTSKLCPSDQAVIAVKNAISNFEGEIDFIILNTFFGDCTVPQTATIIQQKLDLKDAFAIELNMPCAGPIYTLAMADMFIKSQKYKIGLLIGVDKILDAIDPEDYIMNALFGEGAGAVLVQSTSNDNGVVDFYLGSTLDNKENDDYSLRLLAGKANYPFDQFD